MILYTFMIQCSVGDGRLAADHSIYLAKFTNGELLGLYAFIARDHLAGSIRCAAHGAGGLLLGVVDNFTAAYISTAVPARRAAVLF